MLAASSYPFLDVLWSMVIFFFMIIIIMSSVIFLIIFFTGILHIIFSNR